MCTVWRCRHHTSEGMQGRGRGQGGSGPHLEKHEAPHVSLAPTLGSASNSQQDPGHVLFPLPGLGFPLCAIRTVRASLPIPAYRVIVRHVHVQTHGYMCVWTGLQMGHSSHQETPLGSAVKGPFRRHLLLAVQIPSQTAPRSKAYCLLLPHNLPDQCSSKGLGVLELEEISVLSLQFLPLQKGPLQRRESTLSRSPSVSGAEIRPKLHSVGSPSTFAPFPTPRLSLPCALGDGYLHSNSNN